MYEYDQEYRIANKANLYIYACVQHFGTARAHSHQWCQCTMHKWNPLNESTQYKTVCSWSLLLLHNTVGSICTVGGRNAGQNAARMSSIFLVYVYTKGEYLTHSTSVTVLGGVHDLCSSILPGARYYIPGVHELLILPGAHKGRSVQLRGTAFESEQLEYRSI